MANEFKPWIDDENVSNSNVQPGVTFIADSQRKNGFEAGQPASSIRVNTALREATLVATALVNLLGQSADLFSAQTSLEDMQTAFASYFGQDVVGVSYNPSNNTLTINFKNGGSQMVPLPSPEDATAWYEGTDVVYISEGDYYVISKSSYPTIKINDLYLITETYTSGGQEIKVGDIFKVIDQNPASVEVQKQLNIAGPQGAAGQPGQPGQNGEDGSIWYHGSDLEINQSNDPWWDERSWPSGADVKEHDYYLVTSTASPFNEGDIYEVIDIGPGGAIMQFVLNIKGASGGSTSLYRHRLQIYKTGVFKCFGEIISDDPTQIQYVGDLATKLQSYGRLQVSGYHETNSLIDGCMVELWQWSGDINCSYLKFDGTGTGFENLIGETNIQVSDTVTQIV